jgi:signal transduction histidine kinase
VAALAALVVLACAALVTLTVLSNRYSRRVTTLNDGLRAVDSVRIDLSALSRESAVAYNTGDPQQEQASSRREADLLARLRNAEAAVQDPRQVALLGQAENQISDYLTVRHDMEARGLPSRDLLLVSAPAVQRSLNTLYEISQLGFSSVSDAEARLTHWELVETALATAVAALLLWGVPAVALALQRQVFVPLLALGDGIDRFAAGDRAARVAPTGPPEVRETAVSFNEMAESLERRDQDLLTFVAGVAHDIKNPLASMRMGVQALQRDRPPVTEEKRRRMLAMIDGQVTRLERMVGDFLDATRIEGGHLDLQVGSCDLRALAREAVELYDASSPAHRVVLSAPEQPVLIACDGARIAQALNNLVSNAVKYSPRGGDVVVSVEERGGEAVVSVRDWGIGIEPSEAKHVFAPFRRTGASRETAPGVGLGLSVARRILEAHKGYIDFDSTPGVGSTFYLRLPRHASEG